MARGIKLDGNLVDVETTSFIASAPTAVVDVWINGVRHKARHVTAGAETSISAGDSAAFYSNVCTTAGVDWPVRSLSRQTVTAVLVQTPETSAAGGWPEPATVAFEGRDFASMRCVRYVDLDGAWLLTEWKQEGVEPPETSSHSASVTWWSQQGASPSPSVSPSPSPAYDPGDDLEEDDLEEAPQPPWFDSIVKKILRG